MALLDSRSSKLHSTPNSAKHLESSQGGQSYLFEQMPWVVEFGNFWR